MELIIYGGKITSYIVLNNAFDFSKILQLQKYCSLETSPKVTVNNFVSNSHICFLVILE
jgi:hypothetical protein